MVNFSIFHEPKTSISGAVQFAQLVRSLEKDDAEVAKLHAQVRSYFLPGTPLNSSTDASL